MALTNYTDLINSINGAGAWLHRTDLATIAPDWVKLCETTINMGDGDQIDGLRTAQQETTSNIVCTPGVQTIPLPANFLEIRRVYITVGGVRYDLIGRPITPISVLDSVNVNAIPETFFISGSNMYLIPIPYQAFTVTLLYYAQVGPLATQGTNWLMTAAPMVYLAGAISHGAPWLGANFNPAPWAAMFRMGMNQVAGFDNGRFSNIQLRSEASNVLRGSYGNWATFVNGS